MKVVAMLFVALALVSCGGDDDTPPDATASPSAERGLSFAGSVAKEVISEDGDGIQVYVVSAVDAAAVAQGCVDFYRTEYEAASCYVFQSQEAFEAAGTSDQYGRAMRNLCWDSYRSVTPDASNGSDDNKKFKPEVCA